MHSRKIDGAFSVDVDWLPPPPPPLRQAKLQCRDELFLNELSLKFLTVFIHPLDYK